MTAPMNLRWQSAVLEPVPSLARYLELDLRPGADARSAVARIPDVRAPGKTVLGFGEPLSAALGARARPALASGGYYWCPPIDARGRLDLSALKL